MRQTDRLVLFYHEFLDPVSDANKKGTGGRPGAAYLKNGLYKPGPDDADIKVQAAARKAAEDKRLIREQTTAKDVAEDKARGLGASRKEIQEAGDKAAADIANDPAAQQRIKAAGDGAQQASVRQSINSGQSSVHSSNTDVLATPSSTIEAEFRALTSEPLKQNRFAKTERLHNERSKKTTLRKRRTTTRSVEEPQQKTLKQQG